MNIIKYYQKSGNRKKKTLNWMILTSEHKVYWKKTLEGLAEATQFAQYLVSIDSCTENAWWEV